MRPLRHSFSVIRRGRKVTASARYPVCMLPSPRSLVSVTGVKLKKYFFFSALVVALVRPKSRCIADGRQLVEGKKGKHVFIYSAGAGASMTMSNGSCVQPDAAHGAAVPAFRSSRTAGPGSNMYSREVYPLRRPDEVVSRPLDRAKRMQLTLALRRRRVGGLGMSSSGRGRVQCQCKIDFETL